MDADGPKEPPRRGPSTYAAIGALLLAAVAVVLVVTTAGGSDDDTSTRAAGRPATTATQPPTTATAAPTTPTTPAPTTKSFSSPSGNLSCEMTGGNDGSVRCQARDQAIAATLTADGQVDRCSGQDCLSDPPEDNATLAYGDTATVGRYECTSAMDGVTCVLTETGKGYRISTQGIADV